ncbi:MAG: hypothetical protein Q7S40_00380 [Opitutaceae bacterium]|nr:hypothetical protein [Opitutaceae bacterium]
MNKNPLFRRLGTGLLALLALFVLGALRAADSAADGGAIDWQRAQQLRQKSLGGSALSAEEQAYLERAMAARQGGQRGDAVDPNDRETMRRLTEKRRKGEPLTAEDEAAFRRLRGSKGATKGEAPAATTAAAPREKTGLVPLTEMTADQRHQGEDGGLYGGGRNDPPSAQLAAAMAAAREIEPLDAAGKPAADGRIALLSVGMSNTTQEFSRFQEMAARDAAKGRNVVLVDGAQGGRTAAEWARSANSEVWQTVDSRLKTAGVSPAQIQVVWMKQANARPTEAFPEHARKLEHDLTVLMHRLKTKFPNLRLVYLSSRTYAGYASTALNPEPYAYEGAFAVRWLILRQVNGDKELNHDPARGPVKAPVLLWGPYLWADGLTPRKNDGFTWARDDFREDGTHPSVTSGRDKVANQLLTFLKTDPTAKPWFVSR